MCAEKETMKGHEKDEKKKRMRSRKFGSERRTKIEQRQNDRI